jgi:hypothetical protein
VGVGVGGTDCGAGTATGAGIAVGYGWEHETIPATNMANTAMAMLFLIVAAPLTGFPSAIYRPLFSIDAAV